MITDKVISLLLAGLAILTVTCAVLMGFQTLFSVLQDKTAARVLLWIGLGCLVLLVTDALLLVGALAARTLEQRGQSSDDGDG